MAKLSDMHNVQAAQSLCHTAAPSSSDGFPEWGGPRCGARFLDDDALCDSSSVDDDTVPHTGTKNVAPFCDDLAQTKAQAKKPQSSTLSLEKKRYRYE